MMRLVQRHLRRGQWPALLLLPAVLAAAARRQATAPAARCATEAGDLIHIDAFQKSNVAHLPKGQGMSMRWAVVRVPPLPRKTDNGYAIDGQNFECRRSFGGVAADYPLPCRAPVDDYTSRASREFVITAWWAPLVASRDAYGSADQLQEYKAAGFNAVRTSNVDGFCQHLNITPTPATATEVFDCIAGAMNRIERSD